LELSVIFPFQVFDDDDDDDDESALIESFQRPRPTS